jgi:cell division protein ZipA
MLAVIPVLGVLALLLIFWDRITWSRKHKTDNRAASANDHNLDHDGWEDDVRVSAPAVTYATPTQAESILEDVGFNTLDDLLTETQDHEPVNTVAPQSSKPVKAKSDALMILYVLAKPEQPFVGYELLQTLATLNLQYGHLNIFHYYEQTSDDQETTLFSVASAVEPGMFDLSNVGGIICPGLSLFMSMQVEQPAEVFEVMLETAQQLAEDLNGIVCDAQRIPLTETRIADYRDKIAADIV